MLSKNSARITTVNYAPESSLLFFTFHHAHCSNYTNSYRFMECVIIPKPNVLSREGINSRCRRFDLFLFRRFGSICRHYDNSCRRSACRCSDRSLAINRERTHHIGKMFDITRGTRQGSKLSPYLFNIFINQLLLDLNDCDVGVRIGDVLYNSMAYADDITVFSTNAKDLQRLIDMFTMYSDRWRFKYGIDKSKCMIIGKSPFMCEPVWRLNDVSLRNVDTIEILGNVFNSKGNNTSHVDNRLNKCRQSFYSLNSLGMSYPGAAPVVQAHLYKSICQPVLTYGMECNE